MTETTVKAWGVLVAEAGGWVFHQCRIAGAPKATFPYVVPTRELADCEAKRVGGMVVKVRCVIAAEGVKHSASV